MSKYNIISKSKGNKLHTVNEITYQVDGYGSTYFKCDMYCIPNMTGMNEAYKGPNGVAYVYLDGNEYPHINTQSDKIDFIHEIYEFQKGSSYRKTHPVLLSDLDKLLKRQSDIRDELEGINKQIEKIKDDQLAKELELAYKKVNTEELRQYQENFAQAVNSDRYKLIIPGNAYIYDKELECNVCIIDIDFGDVKFDTLNSQRLLKLMK